MPNPIITFQRGHFSASMKHYRRHVCFLCLQGEQGTEGSGKERRSPDRELDEIKIAEDERAWDIERTGARVAIRKMPTRTSPPHDNQHAEPEHNRDLSHDIGLKVPSLPARI